MALTSLQIDESIHIAAAPEIVWKFLADPRSWQHWWPGCRHAETRDRKPLHDGSILNLGLHLGWLTLRFSARIEAATPQKSLIWAGTGGGLTGATSSNSAQKPNVTYSGTQTN